MKDYDGKDSGKGGSLKHGLSKKMKFTPEEAGPKSTSVGRPKHEGMVKRHVAKPRG